MHQQVSCTINLCSNFAKSSSLKCWFRDLPPPPIPPQMKSWQIWALWVSLLQSTPPLKEVQSVRIPQRIPSSFSFFHHKNSFCNLLSNHGYDWQCVLRPRTTDSPIIPKPMNRFHYLDIEKRRLWTTRGPGRFVMQWSAWEGGWAGGLQPHSWSLEIKDYTVNWLINLSTHQTLKDFLIFFTFKETLFKEWFYAFSRVRTGESDKEIFWL